MAPRNIRAGACALAAAALLTGLVAFASTAFAPVAAQAALPAASVMAPPACTCSEPTAAVGQQIQNCQCGVLQCAVVGAKGTTPAIMCVR